MLAKEIVDPLPQTAVDLLNKLNMTATEPGSGQGQCMAEQYFNDADGVERRALLAYDCDNGLLIYLWSPECCYGVMTDYRKFHGKNVAYATKDDPINIRINILKELENPDESLFAVSKATPAEKRMTTIQMSETKVRALALEKPEMSWPPLDKKPEGTGANVEIVVGRNGHVKDAWCYSNAGEAVKAAALSTARKWTFSPQNVDGVPAQVQSHIIFPFPPTLKAAASGPVVSSIFDRMRQAVDIRLEGSPAFHLKASFNSEDVGVKGSYEETWISPKKWRREVAVNDAVVVEVQTEDAFYRTFPGKYAPRLADDILDALSFNLPGDNGTDFHEPDWTAVDAKLFNLSTLRLSQGYINPQGRPDAFTQVYFVEEKTGFVRGRFHYVHLTVFNDLQMFGEKNFARKLTLLGTDVKKMEITVDTLELAKDVNQTIFQLPGTKPVFTKEEEDQRFTQPQLIYTVKPTPSGWHGDAMCDLQIDEHGHVRSVEVKGITDDSVVKSIRAALMTWEYQPATINGHPSLGFAHVKVQ
jgi:hypothetical protein